MFKQPRHSAVSAELSGVARLLRLQVFLLTLCLGLGGVLYGLPPLIATAALLLTLAMALSLSPATGHWVKAFVLATVTMFLLAALLPPDWLHGPAYAVLALLCAAAGLLGINRPG